MTVNYLIGGSTSLQNELLKLLGENQEIESSTNKDTKSPSDNVDQPSTNKETIELNNVIKDAVIQQNIEDAKFVNSDMSGGTNIVGLVENILAGGGLNNDMNENEKQNKDMNEKQNNNAAVSGEEIIGNILIEGGKRVDNINSEEIKEIDKETGQVEEDKYISDEDTIDGSEEKNISSNSDEDSADDDDDELDSQYIKIINEMRNYNDNSDHQNISLSGGSVKTAKRVKILNMFPWILKSSD